jgi:uncharacterized protein (TIGR02217 family)
MSDPIFPDLAGLAWTVTKTPNFSTRTQRGTSGRELRLIDQPLAIWDFSLNYDFLRDQNDTRAGAGIGPGVGHNELRTLMGFYLSRQGSFATFLFDDPTDNTVVGLGDATGVMGPGDGVSVSTSLLRQLLPGAGQYTEPVAATNTVTAVYVNGVDPGGWTVDADTAVVTFGSAPPAGATLSWDGTFYFRCRFALDQAEFSNFLYQLWSLKQLKFSSVLS